MFKWIIKINEYSLIPSLMHDRSKVRLVYGKTPPKYRN